jgi:uncharacterized membrane protein (GlpM family)
MLRSPTSKSGGESSHSAVNSRRLAPAYWWPATVGACKKGFRMPTIYRILVGCALVTAVAIISDRSRVMAGILGTAPINIPIILWILWGKSDGDYTNVADTTRAMLLGIFSTACFIAACWYGFNRRWPFGLVLTAGYLIWAAVAFGPELVRRLVERG